MSISAETVKTLRERTGAGMMECKKALIETGGDLDAAAEIMRKAGLAKADKKAGRIAAEGTIATAQSGDGRAALLAEVNCETDFVARQPEFQAFAAEVARAALAATAVTPEALASLKLASGATVDETRRNLVAKIGEKIDVRRFARFAVEGSGLVVAYVHGGKIGALVELTASSDAVDARRRSTAMRPSTVARSNRFSRSITSIVASMAVMATGLPPKVEIVFPCHAAATSSRAIVAPTGNPEAMALAMTMMSGSTPQCSMPNHLSPVLPNPACTSSAMNRPPCFRMISATSLK